MNKSDFLNSLNCFQNNGLSIIITAYKTQEFIEECLDSIQSQTYFKYHNNYEILLGIDACEITLKKVKEIRKKYRNLKVFYASENGGTYRMRNSLWIRSKYENLLFFDSDDVMPSNLLNDIMKYSNEKLLRFKYYEFKNNNMIKRGNGCISHGQMFIKKEFMEYLNGYYDERAGMDTEIIDRAEKKIGKVKILDCYFWLRIHGNNLTRNKQTGFGTSYRKQICEFVSKRKSNKTLIHNDKFALNNSVSEI